MFNSLEEQFASNTAVPRELGCFRKTTTYNQQPTTKKNNKNNQHPIWRGSVLTGEELPPHSGALNHALSPSRWSNPLPAIPPYVVMARHLFRAPTAEETSTVKTQILMPAMNIFGRNTTKKRKRRNTFSKKKNENEKKNEKHESKISTTWTLLTSNFH